MNRKELRKIIFAQAVERGGTKRAPELRRLDRRNKSRAARRARRANRAR